MKTLFGVEVHAYEEELELNKNLAGDGGLQLI